MDHPPPAPQFPRTIAWFPEFLRFGKRRVRTQVRLMGLAMLVGLVAGLGAIVFYVSTRVVADYCLGTLCRL